MKVHWFDLVLRDRDAPSWSEDDARSQHGNRCVLG